MADRCDGPVAFEERRDGVEFFARLSDEASRQAGQALAFSA